jgi:hypothetical protein
VWDEKRSEAKRPRTSDPGDEHKAMDRYRQWLMGLSVPNREKSSLAATQLRDRVQALTVAIHEVYPIEDLRRFKFDKLVEWAFKPAWDAFMYMGCQVGTRVIGSCDDDDFFHDKRRCLTIAATNIIDMPARASIISLPSEYVGANYSKLKTLRERVVQSWRGLRYLLPWSDIVRLQPMTWRVENDRNLVCGKQIKPELHRLTRRTKARKSESPPRTELVTKDTITAFFRAPNTL